MKNDRLSNNDNTPDQFLKTHEMLDERMKNPEGDPIPKSPRHSDKRRVELDR